MQTHGEKKNTFNQVYLGFIELFAHIALFPVDIFILQPILIRSNFHVAYLLFDFI